MFGFRGGRQQSRRCRDDTLGLARQLERGKRRGDALLSNPLNHLSNLGKRIHRRNGGDHGEGADTEERQQQAPSHVKSFEHGGLHGLAGGTGSIVGKVGLRE